MSRRGARVWTFHEEARGWQYLIAHLSRLPGFQDDWYAAVVTPPFSACETAALFPQRAAQLHAVAPSEMLMLMRRADYQWSLCNPGPDALLVWLEPWCEDFEVPARSTITLKPEGGSEERGLGDVEWSPDYLVIWATGPTVAVFVDGVLQDSGSAVNPIPDGLTKEMLNLVFSGQPAARLGGTPYHAIGRTSWWGRVRRLLGR